MFVKGFQLQRNYTKIGKVADVKSVVEILLQLRWILKIPKGLKRLLYIIQQRGDYRKLTTRQFATRRFATKQLATNLIATTVQLLLGDICYYSI